MSATCICHYAMDFFDDIFKFTNSIDLMLNNENHDHCYDTQLKYEAK